MYVYPIFDQTSLKTIHTGVYQYAAFSVGRGGGTMHFKLERTLGLNKPKGNS